MRRNNDRKSKKQMMVSIDKIRPLQTSEMKSVVGGQINPCPNSVGFKGGGTV